MNYLLYAKYESAKAGICEITFSTNQRGHVAINFSLYGHPKWGDRILRNLVNGNGGAKTFETFEEARRFTKSLVETIERDYKVTVRYEANDYIRSMLMAYQSLFSSELIANFFEE